jgi:hypothetical protein
MSVRSRKEPDVAYEPLTQLVVEENPYGDIVTSPMMDAAVAEVKEELEKLRDKARDPKTTPEELAELKRRLEYVDGPAAMYHRGDVVPAAAAVTATIAAPNSPGYDSAVYDAFMAGLFWHFKGKPVRISKALRLEYEYEEAGAAPGQPKRTYSILIGFEGSGGGI